MQLHVHLLPALTSEEDLAGGTVVVIDVLRATTTIAHALAAGATRVIPCLEVEQARACAAEIDGAVLGGERGGVPIEGFDYSNSPRDYTPANVAGRTVVFTTTNGTSAMMLCRQARRVLTGAFVNFTAVCNAVSGDENVHLLCAGTNGEITREDVLLAGAIAHYFSQADTSHTLNDQAAIAAAAWRDAVGQDTSTARVTAALRESRGGRNLIRLGYAADIEIAATLDKFNIAPVLDLQAWQIEVL